MASNDLEILDPAVPAETSGATVEMNDQQELLRPVADQLNRRFFMAALGVAGAAAGTALFTAKSADAQQIKPNGYAQVDVLNLMLNIKYLKATFYSFLTQGTDLPGASGVTIGTGQVFNQPAKITFSSQQITDIFNEMYYDELNQLITLRGLLGVAVAPRQTMDILGTGNVKTATVTLNQSQAIAQARLLEDLSASAFTTAAVYLTGNNLQFASQALATDAMHAGAIRLLSIQNNVQYQGAQFASYTTSNTASTSNSFTGETILGSSTIYANLPVAAPAAVPNGPSPNEPAVGNILSGIGIPLGPGAIVTSVTPAPAVTFTAISNANTTLTNVSSTAGLAFGQPITGTFINAGTYINAVGTNTVTLSAATSKASTVAPTGFVTNGSPTITGVSSTSGLIAGQAITGAGIQSGTTILSFSSSAGTITMSANATVTSVATVTGVVTAGSPTITNLSNFNPLVIGQPITGAGIPANATILAVTSSNATLSANATANSPAGSNVMGTVTSGNKVISGIASTAGVAVGQQLAGAGIPTGATVTAVTANSITSSASPTASSFITPAPSASTVQGSNVLTQLSSPAGISVGQTITSTGIPANTTITAVGTNTLTISNAATFTNSSIPISVPAPEAVYFGGEVISSPTTVAVTSPTNLTFTVGQGVVTIAGAATVTGFNTFAVVLPDNQDVEPGDPGSASVSASGPSPLVATVSGNAVPANPPIYQGFFNTAGAVTTIPTSTLPGFAFARSFQQILAVLYGYNSTNSQIATQNYQGGFFPVGVSGPINSAI